MALFSRNAYEQLWTCKDQAKSHITGLLKGRRKLSNLVRFLETNSWKNWWILQKSASLKYIVPTCIWYNFW